MSQQHHQQQQFSFVVSDFVAILNASLFCIGTQIPINLAPSLRLQWPILIQLGSMFANWPLPHCVRDHNVYIDDSCCWWRWCWLCCPILTPFDPFDALCSSALLSPAPEAVIMSKHTTHTTFKNTHTYNYKSSILTTYTYTTCTHNMDTSISPTVIHITALPHTPTTEWQQHSIYIPHAISSTHTHIFE